MSEQKLTKAGKLLCVDCGDYGGIGFFVVLRDFDPRAELVAHPEQRKGCKLPRELARALGLLPTEDWIRLPRVPIRPST